MAGCRCIIVAHDRGAVMRFRGVALFANAIFFAGCSSFYTGGAIDEAGWKLAPTPRWQHVAGPLSATDIAALAIENSLELKSERNGLEVRSGAWHLGLRGFLPRIEVSAGSDERLAIYDADSFGKNISMSIAQPLWDGGRLLTTRALESAEMALARAELDRKARAVGENAIASSRAVLSANARLEIKSASHAAALEQRFILVTEIDLGLAKAVDLLEADASLAEMELDLAGSELELATAKAELAEILRADQLPELIGRPAHDKRILRLDPVLVVSTAIQRSPELMLARYSLVQKRAEYQASKYSWLPKIGFKVSGSVSGSEYPLTRATWSAGMTVDFSSPLLSGSSSAQYGADSPASHTARSNNRLDLLPDPAGLFSSGQAARALELAHEEYAVKLGQVERSARMALGMYENAGYSRDRGIRSLELSESKLRLMTLKIEVGQAMRTELIKAELERATREVELVDEIAALESAERGLEILFDIPPGSLALFWAAQEGSSP